MKPILEFTTARSKQSVTLRLDSIVSVREAARGGHGGYPSVEYAVGSQSREVEFGYPSYAVVVRLWHDFLLGPVPVEEASC
ncbi:MAG: hypothetical protein H6832_14875 [Planctomycetes bacterium]|nr:hypothetical protein [Planctomycetota bacterium]